MKRTSLDIVVQGADSMDKKPTLNGYERIKQFLSVTRPLAWCRQGFRFTSFGFAQTMIHDFHNTLFYSVAWSSTNATKIEKRIKKTTTTKVWTGPNLRLSENYKILYFS